MNDCRLLGPAALLTALAITNTALAQPATGFRMDGILNSPSDPSNGFFDAEVYGPAAVLQVASVIDGVSLLAVDLSASLNNTNVGGVAAFDANFEVTDPATVTTGAELSIELAETGYTGGPVKVFVAINGSGHDFLSNSVVGTSSPANIGEPRTTDFSDEITFPGNQFVVAGAAAGAITVDGTLDAASYGSALWVASQSTGFGDNEGVSIDDDGDPGTPNINVPSAVQANGSEFNAVYAVIDDLGNADPADDVLHIFIAGNLESNFNKAEVFLSTQENLVEIGPGIFEDQIGQRTVLADNPDVDFGALQRMAATGTPEDGPGLTFDLEFAADYYITFTTGNVVDNGTPNDVSDDTAELFVNAVVMNTTPDPADPGTFIGQALLPAVFTGAGAAGLGDVSIALDQSNVGGVAGGIASGLDVPNDSDPALIDTGIEFSVDLNDLAWNGTDPVRVSGFLSGQSADQISNQVIGGLPADTAPLGLAREVNFDDNVAFPGDQFIVAANSGAAPATIDGTRDASYPAPQYVNPGNSTAFGNNTLTDIDLSQGSEINNASAYIDSAGVLHVHIGGNAHDFNRFVFFVDVDGTASGQNRLRGDNFDADGQVRNLGDLFGIGEGLQFDAGHAPDLVVIYHSGFQADAGGGSGAVTQFLDAASIPTVVGEDPNPSDGGRVPDAEIELIDQSAPGTVTAITGQAEEEFGFGDNAIGAATPEDIFASDGNELNALYARVGFLGDFGTEPYLFLMLTGNLEGNSNRLHFFFDIDPLEGQNTLLPENATEPNPDVNFNALGRMGGILDPDTQIVDPAGLTFDDDGLNPFTPTHFLVINSGNFRELEDSGGNPTGEFGVDVFGDFALLTGTTDPTPGTTDQSSNRYLGVTISGDDGLTGNLRGDGVPTGGDLGIEEAFRFNLNNSNIGGVAGAEDQFGDVSDAGNVTTGIEIGVPISALAPWQPFEDDGQGGLNVTPIKVFAQIASAGSDFISNQTIPGVCSLELGEPRLVNYNDFQGDQFVELVYDAVADDGSLTVANAASLPDPCVNVIPCPGDTDGNATINLDDLLNVVINFGTAGPTGDVDNDGDVDLDDLLEVVLNFGVTCS